MINKLKLWSDVYMSKKKKIYMAIADTGGGHRAAANSLINVFNNVFQDEYEIMVDNIFENTKKIGKKLENAYAKLNSRFTFIFGLAYILTSLRPLLWLSNRIMGVNAIPKTAKKLKEFQPDLIVSIHPLVELILKKAMQKAGIDPLKAVVITDPITAHLGWYSQKMYDLYVVSSDRLKNKLIKAGIKESLIKIHCPPLDPKFDRPLTPEEINTLKNEFDFPKDKNIIFFAGGGEGFKNIDKYIKYILEKPHLFDKAYFVVVTGKNKAQKELLEVMTKDYKDNFRIIGFTKQMYELTGISDIVIGKAGPATTYQALLLKKPIIHTMYIYGQEKGNTELIVNNGYGEYIPNIKKLVDKLEDLIINDEKLEKMKENVRETDIINGSEGIARELAHLLDTGSVKQ